MPAYCHGVDVFCSYVQGINDLLIPFLIVFLRHEGGYSVAADVEKIPKQVLDNVEADSFWCLSKLLDGLQDHYIASQPGALVRSDNFVGTLIA